MEVFHVLYIKLSSNTTMNNFISKYMCYYAIKLSMHVSHFSLSMHLKINEFEFPEFLIKSFKVFQLGYTVFFKLSQLVRKRRI